MAGRFAGVLEEIEQGYRFTYDPDFRATGIPIGYRYPLSEAVFESPDFPPLFDNLVSEGWLRRKQSITQKIDEGDRFGLLMNNGADLIGALTLEPEHSADD